MSRSALQQIALKPQDLFVLFALRGEGDRQPSYSDLANRTGLAASAIHGALKRAAAAGLVLFRDRRPSLVRSALRDFVIGGARYAFPPVKGQLARGIPTGYAAPPLNTLIAPSSDPPPVWPHAEGSTRGIAIAPLYPSAASASLRDPALHELLALFDAIRDGQARERELARKLIAERL